MCIYVVKIINEWTDYNNHMNLSFYILVFDKAAEKILSETNEDLKKIDMFFFLAAPLKTCFTPENKV